MWIRSAISRIERTEPGEAPKAFSFEASLIIRGMPSSAWASLTDFPGTYFLMADVPLLAIRESNIPQRVWGKRKSGQEEHRTKPLIIETAVLINWNT